MRPDHENEKIVNIEERIPKIKEQRKQKANRRLISFILLFFIMVLIIVYLQTPISKISSLTISGNEHVPTKQLVKLSQIKEGETEFWNLNKDMTADHIKQNKLIKSVSIKNISLIRSVLLSKSMQILRICKRDIFIMSFLKTGRLCQMK